MCPLRGPRLDQVRGALHVNGGELVVNGQDQLAIDREGHQGWQDTGADFPKLNPLSAVISGGGVTVKVRIVEQSDALPVRLVRDVGGEETLDAAAQAVARPSSPHLLAARLRPLQGGVDGCTVVECRPAVTALRELQLPTL